MKLCVCFLFIITECNMTTTLNAILGAMSKSRIPASQPVRQPPSIQNTGVNHSRQHTAVSADSIMTHNQMILLQKMLDDPNAEVEISIGSYSGRSFRPGVLSLGEFLSTKRNLLARGYKMTVSNTTTESDGNVRRVTDLDDGSVIYEKKIRNRRSQIENRLWGWRISTSSEEEVEEPSAFNPNFSRKRTRYSFVMDSKTSEFFGVRFDLSVIEETPNAGGKTYTKYEVEVERIDSNTTASTMKLALEVLFMYSQNVSAINSVLSIAEREKAVSAHNSLFNRDMTSKNFRLNNPFKLYRDYWNKPVNLKHRNLLDTKTKWALTIKMDGTRRILNVTPTGVYMYSPPNEVSLVGRKNVEMAGTLIDGELMIVYDKKGRVSSSTYYAFDILFFKGKDIRAEGLLERLEYLKTVSLDLVDIEFVNKKYYYTDDLYADANVVMDDIEANKEHTDGVIYQPLGPYLNKHTYKWKPAELMTIDFLLSPVKGKKDTFWLMTSQRGGDVAFKGNEDRSFTGQIHIPGGKIDSGLGGDVLVANRVVECVWDEEAFSFVPYRLREDRDRPNGYNVAHEVWRDIIDPISSETIRGNTLRIMRKYHNLEKERMLKANFKRGDTIMDWGSGRGGDLNKWKNAGLDTVYAVEPNDENRAELERRMKNMKNGANVNVLPYGAQLTDRLQEDISSPLNGIVSFFSLTYFPSDKKMYEGMIESICRLLPVGGKFVGAVLDGVRTRDLLEATRFEKNISAKKMPIFEAESYGGGEPPFTVKQVTKFDDNAFGDNRIEISINDPNSMVKDQEEWLFYFGSFSTRMEECGMKLVRTGFLDNGEIYNVLPKGSKQFTDLNRYFVFEKMAVEKVEKVVSKSVKGPSSLVHAVLLATDDQYPKTAKLRKEYVEEYRRQISDGLTTKTFGEIGYGTLREAMVEKLVKDGMKRTLASKQALKSMKEIIADPTKTFGECIGIEYLSKLIKANIYILDGDYEPVSIFGKEMCGILYHYDKSVVLQTTDKGKTFGVVSKKDAKNATLMIWSEEQTADIREKICG